MVQIASLLAIAGASLAATTGRRQTSPAAAAQVVQLASVENIAVRPNGILLTTQMTSPNLVAVNPVTKTFSTAVAVTGATGLSGIAEITPDVFAVIADKDIYKIDFTGGTPKASLIKRIADATTLNGLAVLDNSTLLVADAGKGVVYSLDVTTGAYVVALSDPTMLGPPSVAFGIDGIKYVNGTVWYTNVLKNSLHRVEVDPATGSMKGTVQTLWTNLMGDDLCVSPAGKIYVATNRGNSVVEVDPAAASSSPKAITTVRGSTACAFGRTSADKNTIYVTGAQGVFSAAVPS